MKINSYKNWQKAQNILCIRLDNIGDVLMNSPALHALKVSGRNRKITLLTSRLGSEIAQLMPFVDEVIAFQAPWIKSSPPIGRAYLSYMVSRLKKYDFDAAVIFTTYSQSPFPAALLAYQCSIPLRLAFCHENPYQLLTDWIPDREPLSFIRHEVDRQLALVSLIGASIFDKSLLIKLGQNHTKKAASILTKEGIDLSKPWLVVHPGATAPSRRYPPELYAKVIQILVRKHKFQVAITGTTQEADLFMRLQETLDVAIYSFMGKTDLATFSGIIKLAPLLISNNTGSVHIAAALKTPVVVLYALTNIQHTPWQVDSRVLSFDTDCKLCYKSICPMGHHNCLTKITPEEVVEAVLGLKDKKGLIDADSVKLKQK